MAGKHDDKVEEIKTFVQRRCQYAQLLPGTSDMQPLNQVYNYQPKQQNAQPAPTTIPLNRLPQGKSNEGLKETADTATYWATSGLNAANVSATKPTG